MTTEHHAALRCAADELQRMAQEVEMAARRGVSDLEVLGWLLGRVMLAVSDLTDAADAVLEASRPATREHPGEKPGKLLPFGRQAGASRGGRR